MNKSLILTVALTVAVGMSLSALPTNSQERQPWTNERVHTDLHPAFENITTTGGTFTVSLADGSIYHQIEMNPHMDKIQWDEAFWYICDGTVIWADSDQDAVARCL